ncbi:hypothetical protein MAA8898_01155 [Maliponia aquimaris]|uniref:Uncharacterized protein n=2 Tax=Maliponia aquimaris TaxID=1673631 RepID=A0A238K3G4_9RHOB|nr:hypothetical protein MAA8898_01155 [Maliponia aquimaris]
MFRWTDRAGVAQDLFLQQSGALIDEARAKEICSSLEMPEHWMLQAPPEIPSAFINMVEGLSQAFRNPQNGISVGSDRAFDIRLNGREFRFPFDALPKDKNKPDDRFLEVFLECINSLEIQLPADSVLVRQMDLEETETDIRAISEAENHKIEFADGPDGARVWRLTTQGGQHREASVQTTVDANQRRRVGDAGTMVAVNQLALPNAPSGANGSVVSYRPRLSVFGLDSPGRLFQRARGRSVSEANFTGFDRDYERPEVDRQRIVDFVTRIVNDGDRIAVDPDGQSADPTDDRDSVEILGNDIDLMAMVRTKNAARTGGNISQRAYREHEERSKEHGHEKSPDRDRDKGKGKEEEHEH